jgi:hypothetical protein
MAGRIFEEAWSGNISGEKGRRFNAISALMSKGQQL